MEGLEKSFDASSKHIVYNINRKNFYREREIKYCWKNEKVVRLYAKDKTQFNDNEVHEKVCSDMMDIATIDGFVNHYSYATVSDFIVKIERYSTLFALEKRGNKHSSPLKATLNALYSFLKTYIFKRGFLDGYPGLLISFSHMTGNFYKYMKLYEANLELKQSTNKEKIDEI